jgi:hypothetical protein
MEDDPLSGEVEKRKVALWSTGQGREMKRAGRKAVSPEGRNRV